MEMVEAAHRSSPATVFKGLKMVRRGEGLFLGGRRRFSKPARTIRGIQRRAPRHRFCHPGTGRGR
jgi:hypothetical protein